MLLIAIKKKISSDGLICDCFLIHPVEKDNLPTIYFERFKTRGMKKSQVTLTKSLLFFSLLPGVISFLSFQKDEPLRLLPDKSHPASSYNSDVLDKWMTMQTRLMSVTPANFNGPFVRIYAYSGVAAYASVYPGISKKTTGLFLMSALNAMPDLPQPVPKKKYHWPSSLNAALAFMNRSMFPMASATSKAAIDSLEKAINEAITRMTDEATAALSAEYGKQVATKIFSWAEMDGYRNGSDPYTPPAGRGLWKPTAPKYASAVTPYWGKLRTIVAGSNENTQPAPPPMYSEDTVSFFYRMVKQVYDISTQLTTEQKNIALFWKDINPGVTAPGHWLNILRQVIQRENIPLDKAALAYALTGIALNDAWISSWKTRYTYNLLRPITYIQTVMGHKEWTPTIATPPHPEYPGGHATMSASVAEVLTELFGNNYSFTDHTYDQFGMMPRTYSSFWTIAREAAISKVYGGIHYRLSVDVGLQQGKDVTQNIIGILLNKGNKVTPKSGIN